MISITRTSKTSATVEFNGQTFAATYDATNRRWVLTRNGVTSYTSSPKLHSIGRLLGGGQVVINGQVRTPRAPRQPGAPRAPRQPRQPGAPRGRRGRRAAGPAFAPAPDGRALSFEALASLETALVALAQSKGVTPDIEKAFAVYQKVKALALGTTGPEQLAALRLAMVRAAELVKAVI
jgi:hypothetical protein